MWKRGQGRRDRIHSSRRVWAGV